MEKEYFVKVDVKEELPTSDGFYFVVEQQPVFNGKNLFVKSLGLFDSRRKRFMNNVSSWLKPLPSMPEQEWVSDDEIETWVKEHGYGGHCTQEWHEGLTDGAKWMRDKLLNKSNQ